MKRWTVFVLVFVFAVTNAEAGRKAKKPARGESPANSCGIAAPNYGPKAPGGGYASFWDLIAPRLTGDIVVAQTHFQSDAQTLLVAAEGGCHWATRRTPKERDEDAQAWGILDPQSMQIMVVAPISSLGQKFFITSHDGWKMFDLHGETGPDGGFVLEPGSHIRIVRCGTSEHRRILSRLHSVLQLSWAATSHHQMEKLDVDPDIEAGPSWALRLLFLFIRLPASASVLMGIGDQTGQSWNEGWSRLFRSMAEVTYRTEELIWLFSKSPSAEETRGDKSASRWATVSIDQTLYKIRKIYEEHEKQGARSDTSWCLDQLLGASASAAPELPKRKSAPPSAGPERRSVPQTTGGSHASLSSKNGRLAVVASMKARRVSEWSGSGEAVLASYTPAPEASAHTGAKVRVDAIKVSGRWFYPVPASRSAAKPARRVRAVNFHAPAGWRDKHLPAGSSSQGGLVQSRQGGAARTVQEEVASAEREAEQVVREADAAIGE